MHPVYEKALTDSRINANGIRETWLSTADVAKLVRGYLKREYPDVKFRVRSQSYSGGSSVCVTWPKDALDNMAMWRELQQFRFEDFDGMIDMASPIYRWLLPNGDLTLAEAAGTEGSRGTIAKRTGARPTADAILVRGGPSHVSGQPDF